MTARGRSFAGEDSGTTAIEFGILALPFFTLVFAVIETAMMFFASQVLDSAVEHASRTIRTGQAQAAGFTLADFRTLMCGWTYNMLDCNAIKIEVSILPDFLSATTGPAVQTCSATTCTWTVTEAYSPGLGRQVVQVSAYYRWPITIVLPYFNLKNQPDNYRLMSATRVFRNEPFT